MRISLPFAILFFVSISAFAQPFTFINGKSIELGGQSVTDSYVDNEGNYYVCGTYGSFNNFNPEGSNALLYRGGTTEGFVAKYSSAGTLLWAKSFNDEGDAAISNLEVDASGNVYVVGYFSGNLYEDNLFLSSASGLRDGMLIKLITDGTLADWEIIPSTVFTYNTVNGLDLDQDGNIYISGEQGGFIFFSRYLPTLSIDYTKSLPIVSGSYNNSTDLFITDYNEVALIGTFDGTTNFDPDGGTAQYTTSGSQDGFIGFYNVEGGSFTGGIRVFGGSQFDYVSGASYRNGRIVIGGSFLNDFYLDGIQYYSTTNALEGYVISVWSSGGVSWVRSFGGFNDDIITSLDINDDNQIYIGGGYSGTTDFDPSSGSYPLTAQQFMDGFILKLNGSGSFLSANSFGGINDNDYVEHVTAARNGVVFTGYFFPGDVDFDPGAGYFPLTNPNAIVYLEELPLVSSISPESASPNQYITIFGSNFTNDYENVKVFFGGVEAEVYSSGTSYIDVRVPPGAPYDRISVSIDGRTAFSKEFFLPDFNSAESNASFSIAQSFSTGQSPSSIEAVDLDGDRRLDLAVTNTNATTPSISILRNSSSLTDFSIEEKVDFPTIEQPSSMGFADFNGDGRLDIVTGNSNYTNAPFTVYQNSSGIGSFSFSNVTDLTHSNLVGLSNFTGQKPAIVDFNRDGKLDVIGVVLGPAAHFNYYVFLNTSTGGAISFDAGNPIPTDFGFNSDIKVADLDGDNVEEILLACGFAANYVYIYKNYSTPSSLNTGAHSVMVTSSSATKIAIGDVDQDSDLDIAVADPNANFISVFQNTSTPGNPSTVITYNLSFSGSVQSINSISFADMDGDLIVDVIGTARDFSNNSVAAIFKNFSSPGSWSFAVNSLADISANGLAITDLNFDGKPDLSFTDDTATASVRLNATISPVPRITGVNPTAGAVDSGIEIYGENFGAFAEQNTVYFGAVQSDVIYADQNYIYLNVPRGASFDQLSVTTNGLTAFAEPFSVTYPFAGDLTTSYDDASRFSLASGVGTEQTVVTDFDGDQKPDLASVVKGSAQIKIYPNLANLDDLLAFGEPIVLNTGAEPHALAAADVDGDGRKDLIVSNLNGALSQVKVFHNQSTSGVVTFSGTTYNYDIPLNPQRIAVNDVNGDGRPEIIVASSTDFFVLPNISSEGSVGFSGGVSFAVSGAAYGISITDFDRDGMPDVAISNTGTTLSVYRNQMGAGATINGGSFALQYGYFADTNTKGLAVADFNHDGFADIVVGRTNGNVIAFANISEGSSNIIDFSPAELAMGGEFLSAGELNGDGSIDFATFGSGLPLTLFTNLSQSILDANSFETVQLELNGQAVSLAVTDLNLDTRADLVFADAQNNTLGIIVNQNLAPQPQTQPSALTFSEITSGALKGTFQPSIENVDGYLVIRKEGTLPTTQLPADGPLYPVGFNLGDGNIVVYSGKHPYFNASGLENNSSHSFAVYAFNGNPGAINYLTDAPLTGIATMGSGTNEQPLYFQSFTQISGGIKAPTESAIDADGNVYLTGYYAGEIDFDPTDATYTLPAGDDYNGFIAKYTASGHLLWAYPIVGINGLAFGEALAVDQAGNVFVNGIFESEVNFPNVDISNSYPLTTFGGFDQFVIKYSPEGTVLGVVQFGSPYYDTEELTNGLDVDAAGNVYIGTEFYDVVSFSNSATTLTSNGGYDVLIARFNNDLSFGWAVNAGGSDHESVRDLDVDDEGNAHLVGVMSSEDVAFQGSSITLSTHGSSDILFAKYDPFGNVLWARNVGGEEEDFGEGIAVDTDESVYVTGGYHNVADFDGGDGTNLVKSSNFNLIEAFVGKYNNEGDLVWVKSLATTVDNSIAGSVKTDGIGNLYACGQYYGNINADPNGGQLVFNNKGQGDNFLVKFSTDGFLRWAAPISSDGEEGAADVAIGPDREVVVAAAYNGTLQYDPADPEKTAASAGQDLFFIRFGNESDLVIETIPTITSLSHQTALIGSQIIISGTNFSSSANENIVMFGGMRATVVSASQTSLEVIVPIGAMYAPVTVTVNGRTAASSTYFNPTYTLAGSFDLADTPVVIPTEGQDSFYLAIGDVDHDSKQDVIVSNAGSNNISVMINGSENGNVAFKNIYQIDLDATPNDLKLTDIDGDGRLDIIYSSYTNDHVGILRNNGNGFNAPVAVTTAPSPFVFSTGDLDGDGKPEIVAAAYMDGTQNGRLSILWNRSVPGSLLSSSFEAEDLDLQRTRPTTIVVADVVGDDRKDIAIGYENDAFVDVIPNQEGELSFIPYPIHSTSSELIVADLNTDGFNDIIAMHSGAAAQRISILKNSSSGFATFFTVSRQDTENPFGPSAGDVDGDGIPDLILATPEILKNTSTTETFDASSFSSIFKHDLTASQSQAALVDFDSDTKPDIITMDYASGSNNLYVFLNTSSVGELATPGQQAQFDGVAAKTPTSVRVNIQDGDGNSMLIVMSQGQSVDQTPVDGSSFDGSTQFGQGTEVNGSGTGNFVVGELASSYQTEYEITNLQPASQYTIRAFEFNDVIAGQSTSASKYLTTTIENFNPISFYTLATEPTSHPSTFSASAEGSAITLTFSSAESVGGSGYLLLRREGSSVPGIEDIVDGSASSNGSLLATILDHQQTSYIDAGLSEGVQYTYTIVPFNMLLTNFETINYLTEGELKSADATTIALAAEPTTSVVNLTVSTISAEELSVSFSHAGDANSFLVVRSVAGQFSFSPVDGVGYGPQLVAQNEYIAYVGSGTSFNDTGLTPNTTYTYTVYPYNNFVAGDNNYLITDPLITAAGTTSSDGIAYTIPSTQASNVEVRLGVSEVDYIFDVGSGAKRLVLLREGSEISEIPVTGINYAANTTFGMGSQIGDASVIAASEDDGGMIGGLEPGTLYSIRVFDYNDAEFAEGFTTTAAQYNTNSDTNNPVSFYTLDTEPADQLIELQAAVSGTSITLTFPSLAQRGADRYMILGKEGSEDPSLVPVIDGMKPQDLLLSDGSNLIAIITNVDQSTFINDGLAANQTYTFTIIPYNVNDQEISETTNYNTALAASVTETTSNLADAPGAPTLFTIVAQGTDFLTIGFTAPSPQPDGYVVIRKASSGPVTIPQNGQIYADNAEVITGEFLTYLSGSATQFTATSLLPGANYFFAIYAYNGAGNSTHYGTGLIDDASTTVDPAPVIVNNTVQSINQGSDLMFSAAITDNNAVSGASVFWRSVAEGTNFREELMFLNGSNFTFTLTSQQMGPAQLGIEYYFEAVDNLGNETSTVDNKSIVTIIAPDNGLVIPYSSFGTDQSNYRIVAVPLNLNAKSANSVFSDEFGTYDKTKWRMFRWNGSSNTELNGSTSIETGKGYWLIAKDNPGSNIFSGPGSTIPVSEDNPFSMQISSGWTQIGNPYNFAIDWSDVVASSTGISNVVTIYEGSYLSSSQLQPMQGGFVFSESGGTLVFPPVKSNSARQKDEELRNSIGSENWEITLNVKQGQRINATSGFGMREEASENWDRFDGISVPRFFEFLELNHHRKVNGYSVSKDIVPTSDSYIWDFSVESNISATSNVLISWDNSYFGNSEKSLILWDIDQQVAIDMKNTNQYLFDQKASGNFRVLFGSPEFVKENTRVNELIFHHVVPNPVRDEALICFTLPRSERITVEVMDVTGKTTEKVFEGMLDEGYHEMPFVGTEKTKGVYIARIKAGITNAQKKIVLE